MKKLILLLSFVAISCSSDETFPVAPESKDPNTAKQSYNPGGTKAPPPDPTILAKVVFTSPGSYQTSWYFYPNGLLRKIVGPFSTRTFFYDNNGNLTQNGNITYDAQNHITSYNGIPITYDPIGNKYIYEVDFLDTYIVNSWEINIDPNGFFQSEVRYCTSDEGEPLVFSGAAAYYSNENMSLYAGPNSNHYFTYDDHPNPLRLALTPVAKVEALQGFDWYYSDLDGPFTSANNLTELNYGMSVPERTTYTYEYNELGYPITRTTYSYNGEVLEATYNSISYYYQGEAIP